MLIATPLAIVPVVLWLARSVWRPEEIALVVVAFASIGHHLPGYLRTYGERDLFRRFRWRFLLAPPLALALSWTFVSRGFHGLELLLLFWATWHALMQTYGFMRIYDLKRGATARGDARLDLALCLAIFAAGMVFSEARVLGVLEVVWLTGLPAFSPRWLDALRWIVGGATGVVCVLYAGRAWLVSRRAPGITWMKILLVSNVGFLYWFSGALSTNVLIGVAMFEIFHAIQYCALVWAYERRRASRSTEGARALEMLFRHGRLALPLYVGAIAAYGSLQLLSQGTGQPWLEKGLLALLSASALLHFYYDGFIWKVGERQTQAQLGVAGAAAARATVSGGAHAAKWAPFLAAACGLFYVETSHSRLTDVDQGRMLAHLAAWTPNLPELQLRISQHALAEGDVETALRAAQKAARLRPNSELVRRQMALAYEKLGATQMAAQNFPAAVKSFRCAVAMDPKASEAHYQLGAALVQIGSFEEARASLERGLALAPDHALARFQLGNIAYGLGDAARAEELYRACLALSPEFPDAYSNLGAVLFEQSQDEAAAQAYRRALELHPANAAAHYNLGLLLINQNDLPEAARHLRRAESLGQPLAPDVKEFMGW